MQQSEPLPITNLVFGLDGTLPPEVLETLPQDLRDRVSAPEFIAQARASIRKARVKDGLLDAGGRREVKQEPIRMKFGAPGFNRKARRRMQAALRG